MISADGADEIVNSNNISLVDVVFRNGHTFAGANGGTSVAPPEAFARALAKSPWQPSPLSAPAIEPARTTQAATFLFPE